jgi:hypothetical protein
MNRNINDIYCGDSTGPIMNVKAFEIIVAASVDGVWFEISGEGTPSTNPSARPVGQSGQVSHE